MRTWLEAFRNLAPNLLSLELPGLHPGTGIIALLAFCSNLEELRLSWSGVDVLDEILDSLPRVDGRGVVQSLVLEGHLDLWIPSFFSSYGVTERCRFEEVEISGSLKKIRIVMWKHDDLEKIAKGPEFARICEERGIKIEVVEHPRLKLT